jgi:opacity protein-like surface antigen
MSARLLAAAGAAILLATAAPASADPAAPPKSTTILTDFGFTLDTPTIDKNAIRFTDRGLLVPTPWGLFEATIVSTPVDRMVRVPLSPNTDPNLRLQPYVTAGSRKNVDGDSVLEQARPASFADTGRTDVKAGAGVLFKIDDNVELFGEYQFMRLRRDESRGSSLGSLGTLDSSGFSLGISVRY